MKGAQILIDRIGGRVAAARLVDGQLDDVFIDPPEDRPRVGAIYRARLGRAMKGMGGRFVEIGDGTAFLRQATGHPDGARLLVQVTGFAEPGKAVPVTADILFKSRHCIVTPGRPGVNVSRSIRDEAARVRLREALDGLDLPETLGVILRTAAAGADPEAVAEDVATTAALAGAVAADVEGAPELLLDGPTPDILAWRDWTDIADHAVADRAGAFAGAGVLDTLAALETGAAELAQGAHLWVEPTRALVAVDVNTGGDTSPAAGLKANIAAARALPRILRLRGLGGQIVMDLAPMPKKDRRQFETVLRTAFRACPVETALLGWTPLGHFELRRKRERLALAESGLAAFRSTASHA